jgi:hypothetical protein
MHLKAELAEVKEPRSHFTDWWMMDWVLERPGMFQPYDNLIRNADKTHTEFNREDLIELVASPQNMVQQNP